MLATRRKMKPGREQSLDPRDIQALYITGGVRPGYFQVADLWDYLDYNPGYIQVNVGSFPNLVAVEGARYVRSARSARGRDCLFDLPGE